MSPHQALKYGAVMAVSLALIATTVYVSPEALARDTARLKMCLEIFKRHVDGHGTVRWRGYYGSAKELAWVRKADCNMVIKRKVWGFPQPARAVRPFIQYFHIPLARVEMVRADRVDYRHDVRLGRLKYYGHSVILKTRFWDIEVRNRLDDAITRERELEIVFDTERAAREFLAVAQDTVKECAVHSLGAGEEWNRIPGP
ncbi:MAG: hypothetical protein AAFS10_11040 [Myxococcota bacterium]